MAFAVVDPYRQVVRSSGLAIRYTADAYLGGNPVAGASGLGPVGGSITDTIKPGVRRMLHMELAPSPGLFDALAPVGTQLAVTAYVSINGQPVATIPMGLFDVDDQKITEGNGRLTITAPDKWQRIVRAKFMGPQTSTSGVRVTDQITYLIQGALGSSERVNVKATSLATVGTLTWDKDRAKAIIDLADGIGAWVYFDRNGVATIADVPTTGKAADWLIDSSASGVLVSLDRQRSRASTYNVVAVESSASGGAAFPAQFCWDSDSSSPTYVAPGPWGPTPPASASSPFGLAVYYFSTPLPLDAPGARAAGGTVLSKTVGRASSVQMTSLPNPAMDAFDVLDVLAPGRPVTTIIGRTGATVTPGLAPGGATYPGMSQFPSGNVVTSGGSPIVTVGSSGSVLERHIVDTVTHPLDVTSPQSIQGRSTRTDAYT